MHKASYDSDGNILLPKEGSEPQETFRNAAQPVVERRVEPKVQLTVRATEWVVEEDDVANLPRPKIVSPEEPITERRIAIPVRKMVASQIIALQKTTRETLREGRDQYHISILSGRSFMERLVTELHIVAQRIWNFLVQPVWVPARKKRIKQYSRGTLFVLDIARFGGTFAAIFAALFVSLNYRSFWEIASADVQSVLAPPSIAGGVRDTKHVAETLTASDTVNDSGKMRGELLSFLPPVGPPESRILIPKLNLNIPLVAPPTEALLRQDWAQVESDIQLALEHGVVHYPGTARPGQAGNFFVTGHSSYYPWAPGEYKNVFARLHALDPGDEYWVYYKGDKHRYIIQDKKEVLPSDITVLDQPENKRISTLMTCTPVGTTLRRLILIAQEVDPVSGQPLHVGERAGDKAAKVQLDALPI